ncbi:MAG: hypothetical protein M0P61_11880 [Ignavibacteriaceae bacterium]|nr:hypothetical protein [Ignavibacteriaceae bacterium]
MIDETDIKNCLLQCWSLQLSSLWTSDNPARGQCGVTALVINDNFGGEILKTKLNNGSWHYYNRIEGKRLDFTKDQFENIIEYCDTVSSRDEAFSDTNEEQYNYLSSAFKNFTKSSRSRVNR